MHAAAGVGGIISIRQLPKLSLNTCSWQKECRTPATRLGGRLESFTALGCLNLPRSPMRCITRLDDILTNATASIMHLQHTFQRG
jgi:hypothetical protein